MGWVFGRPDDAFPLNAHVLFIFSLRVYVICASMSWGADQK